MVRETIGNGPSQALRKEPSGRVNLGEGNIGECV